MTYLYPFEKFQMIWEHEPKIITDTNGLLNIYRYRTESTEHILQVFDLIFDQIWLPAQVLEEFYNNHRSVVSDEKKKFGEVKSEILRITSYAKNDFEKQFLRFSKFKFPNVKELHKRIQNLINNIADEANGYVEEIADEIERNNELLKQEKVKTFVEKLISYGSIGEPFNITTLLKIYSEGEQRYKYLIPPGYKDAVKDKSDPTQRQKYGDLIVWKQLLAYAAITQKPVVFITNDEKEDWWEFDRKQKPVGPRKELLSEFREISDKEFVMISLNDFIDHVSKINKIYNIATHIEMNAENVIRDLIDIRGLDVNFDSTELLYYLIHSGDLQGYIDNLLEDVEIQEYKLVSLDVDTSINHDLVNYAGKICLKLEASITESFSKSWSESTDNTIWINGSINIDFNVDLDKDEDFIKSDTVRIQLGGFEIFAVAPNYLPVDIDEDLEGDEYDFDACAFCGDKNPIYSTDKNQLICENCSLKRDLCPNCSKFFERGTIGAFCSKCEREQN